MASVSMSLGNPEEPLTPQTTVVKRARTEEGTVTTQSVPIEDITNRVRVKVKHAQTSAETAKENPLVYNPTSVMEVEGPGPLEGGRGIPIAADLVPVRGNDRVLRCPRCNTFVKKGSDHSLAECNARLQRKAAGRASASSSNGVLRRRIRLTPKRRKVLEDLIYDATRCDAIVKLAPRLEKWIVKKEKKLTKPSKKLFVSLLSALRDRPNAKRLKTNYRKAGLVK